MHPETPCGRLATRLRLSERATREFFGGLNADDWDQTVYREDSQWSVRAILAHFVSAERAMRELLQDILAGKPGAPPDFNIDEFNRTEVEILELQDPQTLLNDFTEARAATVEITERMNTDDMQRRGCHPWLGYASVSNIIKLIYLHNQIHERDIRRALRTRHPNPVA